MRTFTLKGYGRIYVQEEEDIKKVKDEIREMDLYEFGYLPEELITIIDEYPTMKYTHKFDALDLDKLTYNLIKKGIFIFCVDSGNDEFLNS